MYTSGNSWMEEQVIRQHHQELLKEAAQYQLLNQALEVKSSQNHGLPLRVQAASWLGNLFVDWGNALLALSPKEQVQEQRC